MGPCSTMCMNRGYNRDMHGRSLTPYVSVRRLSSSRRRGRASSYSRPGGWNYPDSLEVGNCHRSKCIHGAEARAHFSLWCVTSAPLYLGMKLDNLSAADLAIVSNRAAIVRYSCALYFAASL